jgi:hypothetical protein
MMYAVPTLYTDKSLNIFPKTTEYFSNRNFRVHFVVVVVQVFAYGWSLAQLLPLWLGPSAVGLLPQS